MNILVLDTETLGLADPRVYNIGWVIYDTEADRVLAKRDYVVKQVFDHPELMATAYYAEKIPLYLRRIEAQECKRVWWGVACNILRNDLRRYKVAHMFAYNSRFDFKAIARTCEKFNTKINPTAEGILDIMDYLDAIVGTIDYKEFCETHGFMTKHKKPRCQKKAETLYRYLTKKVDYNEEHTALADSLIELAILLKTGALEPTAA